MKKSVILEIFRGNRNIETMLLPKDITFDFDTEYKLIKKLNSRQRKLFDKFIYGYTGYMCKQIDFYSVENFKLGLLIGMECIDN